LLVHGYTAAYDEVSLDIAAYLNAKRAVSAPLYGKWSSDFEDLSGNIIPSEATLAELENRGYLTRLTISGEKERIRSIAASVHSNHRHRKGLVTDVSGPQRNACPDILTPLSGFGGCGCLLKHRARPLRAGTSLLRNSLVGQSSIVEATSE
jgi:hypothetical protein